jgi:hypothetical protein
LHILVIASGSGHANLAKDSVKVKTYSDLIVLKQDVHDNLGEPARWVLYVVDFDKSPYPAMDKAPSRVMDEYVLDP